MVLEERRYKCETCDKDFKLYRYLWTHQKKVHGVVSKKKAALANVKKTAWNVPEEQIVSAKTWDMPWNLILRPP